MSTRNTFIRNFLVAVIAASAMGLAWAQGPTSHPTAQQESTQLMIRDVYDRVQAAGYQDMTEIELDDGRYEVKATDAQGQRVKLYVNATTGEIEHVKRKGTDQRQGQ